MPSEDRLSLILVPPFFEERMIGNFLIINNEKQLKKYLDLFNIQDVYLFSEEFLGVVENFVGADRFNELFRIPMMIYVDEEGRVLFKERFTKVSVL